MRSNVPQVLIVSVSLLTVLAVAVPGPAAAHVSQWQLRNAHWDVAPVDTADHLFALRMSTTGAWPPGLLEGPFGSITLFVEDGLQIDDLTALAFDVMYASGGCGGGSPRVQVGVDLNGDGSTDARVQVYGGPAPSYVGCSTGVWVHEDLIARADPNWDTGQLPGGAFYDTQADAHALALAASAGSYELTSLNLVWDSFWMFGPAETWFDNVQVNDHTLSEPVGTELWCPVTPDGSVSLCVV